MDLANNWWILALLIGFGLLLVYFILPRFIRNYSIEKGMKLAIFLGMMVYLSIDFYLKEKYAYIAFFAIGAVVYTYLVIIAKRKY